MREAAIFFRASSWSGFMPTTSFDSIRHEAKRVAIVEAEVVERPGREEAARQGTHRRSRRQVLVLGLGDEAGVLLHLRESGRSLGEERRDVLDEGVGGVN